MNTYSKFCPNVFLAQCTEQHKKGDTILLQTKYGKENECIVFNFMGQKNGFYYYSIVRADGFDFKEHARRRAERLQNASINVGQKSTDYWNSSNEGSGFLGLGEPIKIGHHSEKRHRALIERNHSRIEKAIEFSKKAESYESRVDYWEARANTINLSMPECLEFYEFKLEQAEIKHAGLKNGTIARSHSFSLTYAKKEVNEAKNNLELAKRLWA